MEIHPNANSAWKVCILVHKMDFAKTAMSMTTRWFAKIAKSEKTNREQIATSAPMDMYLLMALAKPVKSIDVLIAPNPLKNAILALKDKYLTQLSSVAFPVNSKAMIWVIANNVRFQETLMT